MSPVVLQTARKPCPRPHREPRSREDRRINTLPQASQRLREPPLPNSSSVTSPAIFRIPDTPPIRINEDCPRKHSECLPTDASIQALHTSVYLPGSLFYVLPMSYMYAEYYPFPPLVPLAKAHPALAPAASSSSTDYGEEVAFKFVFCPCGITSKVHKQLIFDPGFPVGGFRKNVTDFLLHSYPDDRQRIQACLTTSSSMWLVGFVLCNGNWCHQVLGGVVYSTAHPSPDGLPVSVFIEFLAVQDPSFQSSVVADQPTPELSLESYYFLEGSGRYLVGNDIIDDSTILLIDQINHHPHSHLGNRRLEVMFLSVTQQLHRSPHTDEVPRLFLQVRYQNPAFRRLGRIGFKLSTHHQWQRNGSDRNHSWPVCTDQSWELPANLSPLLDTYVVDDENMCLLVNTFTIHLFYPPSLYFGSPEDLEDDETRLMFHKFSLHCMLPTPPRGMSINFSPNSRTRDALAAIKSVFFKDEVGADPMSPDSYISRSALLTREDCARYLPVDNDDDVSAAFRLPTIDNGSGFGINHSDPPSSQPIPEVDGDYSESKACFWVSVAYALYGDLYQMGYSLIKICILDILLRYSEMHPEAPPRVEARFRHIQALEEAEIRESTEGMEEALATALDGPITDMEYQQLWAYDIDDNNMATSAAQMLVSTHFLQPRLPAKHTQLLIFTVKKRIGFQPLYLVDIMSPTVSKLVADEKSGLAQYYAIVNVQEEHYINFLAPESASTDPTHVGEAKLCRIEFQDAVASATSKKRKTSTDSNGSSSPSTINDPPILHKADRSSRRAGLKTTEPLVSNNTQDQCQWMMWDGEIEWGRKTKNSKAIALDPAWVLWNWPVLEWRRQWLDFRGQWRELTAGDSSMITGLPPSPSANPIAYQEHGRTCLASSFASVLHMAGHEQAARTLEHHILQGKLDQGVDLLQRFVNTVNSLRIRDVNSRERLSLHRRTGYDIFRGPTPAVVVLRASDSSITHAVSIYNDFIVDASVPHALPRTRDTLDWCCAGKYRAPHKVYILK
jgi:hypothetical protein